MIINNKYEKLYRKLEPLIKKPLTLSILALACTYLIFTIFRLNAWVHSWLQGDYYLIYQLLYLFTIFILFQLYIYKLQPESIKYIKTILYGIIAGYCAGIIAYIGATIFVDYNYERFINSIRVTSIWNILIIPSFMVFSWLFGGIMAFILVFLLHWRNRKD